MALKAASLWRLLIIDQTNHTEREVVLAVIQADLSSSSGSHQRSSSCLLLYDQIKTTSERGSWRVP